NVPVRTLVIKAVRSEEGNERQAIPALVPFVMEFRAQGESRRESGIVLLRECGLLREDAKLRLDMARNLPPLGPKPAREGRNDQKECGKKSPHRDQEGLSGCGEPGGMKDRILQADLETVIPGLENCALSILMI